MASFYTRPQHPDNKIGCGKCGYVGHLTYQCRNFQQANPNKPVGLEVNSTKLSSSDEELDTPLQQIAQEEIRREKEKKESSSKKSKKTKRKRHRSPSTSSSSESKSKKKSKHSSKSKKSKHRRHHS